MRRLLALWWLPVVGACWPARGAPAVDTALCGVARQPIAAPDTLVLLVEIPAGGRDKFEFDARSGRMVVSRVLPDSLPYPAPYGAFPCTLAGDGDPLDALILDAAPTPSGSVVRVHPVGILRMLDKGRQDDKIIVMPADRPYRAVPEDFRRSLERFFTTYKGPDGGVELRGWGDATEARAVLAQALAAAAPLN